MIFNSIEFLLFFLPVFLVVYGIAPRKWKNGVLLLGSLLFYVYGERRAFWVLAVSLLGNYELGRRIKWRHQKSQKQKKRRKETAKNRWLLALGLAGNAGVLVYCKAIGTLPLGISFYTFQMMAYLIDVYRRKTEGETSLLHFANYTVMFPQLVVGPIVRYQDVRERLRERDFTAGTLQSGAKLFVAGLASKVLLADRLGILWHEVWVSGYENMSTPLAWLAAVAYSLKLYFDFYGYSLMAVGLGRMLGFDLPQNFRTPYMSGSVSEFYRRWHITLGRWFRDYVYIPLGGSREGAVRTVGNLLLVWLLTGLWHGVGVNYLIWSVGIWVLIVWEKGWKQCGLGAKFPKAAKALSHLYVCAVIPVTWVCFAITDLGELAVYLRRMFGLGAGVCVQNGDFRSALGTYGALLAAGVLGCTPLVGKCYRKIEDRKWFLPILAGIFWLCVHRLVLEGSSPFMYLSY